MKKATVNDYFRHHWVKLMLFALFTAAVSFFAPLKNFQLKWLIDSKSKQEALGYMGLVFLITFTSWFFERLSRRSFTKLACGAVEQVRGCCEVEPGKHEITIYTSCCSAQRGIYYYTTYENRRISAVDMHRCNLDTAALARFAPRTEEDVFYQN